MRETRFLSVDNRELWVGEAGQFTGREWNEDLWGIRRMTTETRTFVDRGEAIDWLYEPSERAVSQKVSAVRATWTGRAVRH